MLKTRLATACAILVSAALLAGCDEPGSDPAAQAQQPATAAPASPDAGAADFGAAPAEMTHDQRSVPLVAASRCNLERADGSRFTGDPMSARDGSVTLSGWVADEALGQVPSAAELRLVSADNSRAWRVPVSPGEPRDDVMALLGGDAAYARPGFSVDVDTSTLPAGDYRAYLVYQGGDVIYSCDNGRVVSVP